MPQQKIHYLSYLCVKVTNIELQTIQIFNLQQMTKPEILVWFYKINSYQPYIAIMMIIQKHPPLQEIETHWIQTSRPLQSNPPLPPPSQDTFNKSLLFKPNKICLLDIFSLILQWNARAWTFYYKNTSINLRGGRGTARSIYQQTYSGPGTHWILRPCYYTDIICVVQNLQHTYIVNIYHLQLTTWTTK